MPLIQIAGLTAAGLLSSATLLGLPTTSADDTTADGGSGAPCGAVWSQLPEDLRADLVGVTELPADERRRALRAIRVDALAGDYGRRVERFAERRDQRVRLIRRHLPVDLKADLREARALRGDAQVEAYRDIRDGALAGEYGDRVQQVAERVSNRRDECGRP